MSWDPTGLLDALEESVAVYEPDGTCVYANPTTARLFDRPREELVGARLWDLFPDAVGNVFHRCFARVAETRGSERFEHHYDPWDRWFENQIVWRDGKIHVFATEVTRRKRAERRLETLARASKAFAATMAVPQVFAAIAHVLAETLGDACNVRIVDDEGASLRSMAVHHVDPAALAVMEPVVARPLPLGEGYTGRVFPHGAPLLVPVVDRPAHERMFRSEEWRAATERASVHSVMVAPLRDAGRPVGVVVTTRDRTRHGYTEEDLALLTDLCDRAGMALTRARLHDEAARALEAERAARLSEAAASRALAETNGTLRAIIASAPTAIALLDPDGTVRLWNPAAEQLFGWTANEVVGHTFPAIPDERLEEFRKNLADVAAGAALAGVEATRLTRDGRSIDVAIWAARVSQPAGTPQCLAMILDVTERRREALRNELLASVTAALAGSLDSRAILQRLAELAVPRFADWCCVDLVAEDGWIERVVVAHADPAKADVARRLRRRYAPLPHLTQGLSAAVATGESQLVGVVTDELLQQVARDEDHLDAMRAMEGRSFVCAPLFVGGRSLGAVTFSSCARQYDRADVALVQALAGRVAAVLENARLYAELRAALNRLESVQAVTSELSRARTPADVGAATVRRGTHAVGAEACLVYLAQPDGALVLLASDGVPEVREGIWQRLVPGSGAPAFEVLARGEAAWIETEADYERFAPEIYARQRASNRLRSFGALPLSIGGNPAGVIVFSFPIGRRFSEAEKQFVTTLVRQCEQALERAQLFANEAHARAEAEEARARAEGASRAKDEFFAMLGHELRNPLAPIVTALQLMKLRGVGTPPREHQIIERQVAHLQRLVDDLLDVARITRGKIQLDLQPVELAEPIAKAIELASPLLEQKQHQLRVDVPRTGLRVHADPTRLAQVIANLLTNAAKYTDVRGRIELKARRVGEDVVLSVADDGTGIDAELLPRVFELFVQGPRASDRGQGGLGLGLTLVRNLVQLHGGSVSADSAGVGRGSTFVVRLPALQSDVAVDEPAATPTPRHPSRAGALRRVLVVDDNVDAAELLAEFLRTAGHDVVLAHDGAQALRALDAFTPDVALLDIGLPVMDGYELAGRLRDRVSVRLAAITGYGQEHDRARSRVAGFEAHFVKPVSPEALLRYVENARDVASPRDASPV